MAEHKKTRAQDDSSALLRFVRTQVDPLSRAFVAMPLARLSVRTPAGSVTLAKTPVAQPARRGAEAPEMRAVGEGPQPGLRHASLVPSQNGEAGRTYVTINAEVVGVFRAAAEPPAPGQLLQADQVLGYIEALRLRNEVRCPMDSVLVAQVVVDGQPVDFGESLFVVDATGTVQPEVAQEAPAVPSAVAELVEPPRM
jgi:acetyl-CoA carboxylase biotin carboxyl carrier protein